MGRTILIGLLALPLWAAELKIENLRLMESEHGLPKREATYVPGETLILVFDVAGLSRERVSMTFKLSFELTDPAGGPVAHWESDETRVTDLFGGAAQPGVVWHSFAEKSIRGRYTATVSVEDTKTRETASASVPVTLTEEKLSIVNLGLAADAGGQIPHGRVLVEREVVYVDFFVAGLKTLEGKAHLQEDLVLLDESGSIIGWEANAVDTELEMRGPSAAIQNRLAITRTGKYIVKVVVRDLNGDGAKAERELPIEVVSAPK